MRKVIFPVWFALFATASNWADLWERKPAGLVFGFDFTGNRLSSPSGHSGTLAGNASVSGKQLILDGSNDFMTLADAAEFSFTDGAGTDKPFSISGWVKFTATGTGVRAFFVKGILGQEWEFRMRNGGGYVSMQLFGASSSVYIGRTFGDTPFTETWAHYVVTYSGSESSSGIAIYKNGVRMDATNLNAGSYLGMSNTAEAIRIGDNIAGSMTFLRLYDYALSAAEVVQLYHAGYGVLP